MGTTNDLTVLLKIDDKVIAEEIQRLLEEKGIYTILKSDNPASSALSVYVGNHVIESLTLMVTKDNYLEAAQALQETPYFDLLADN